MTRRQPLSRAAQRFIRFTCVGRNSPLAQRQYAILESARSSQSRRHCLKNETTTRSRFLGVGAQPRARERSKTLTTDPG